MNSITCGTRLTSAIEVPLRTRCCMSKMRRHRPRDPSPSVVEPRQPLLLWAYSFVRAARLCPGVRRIALLGSMITAKAIPKDVDLLVTIERTMDLTPLARAGRRLKGLAQTINLGADIERLRRLAFKKRVDQWQFGVAACGIAASDGEARRDSAMMPIVFLNAMEISVLHLCY